MKSKFAFIVSFIMMMMFLSSCKELLENNPLDKIPADLYYKTEDQVKVALTACYSRIMYGNHEGNIGTDMSVCSANAIMDCFADNGYIKWGFLGVTSGNLLPSSDPVNTVYTTRYQSIAIFNAFIANMEKPDLTFVSNDAKNGYIAQVKFLRAYNYFFITQLYGDLVLTLKPETQDFQEARVPQANIIEAILNDLDFAITNLPDKPYNEGLVVRGAAYALKMKVLLYKKDYEGVIGIWNKYFDTGENKFKIDDSFADLFRGPNQQKSSEIIFSAIYVQDQRYRNDVDVTFTHYVDLLALSEFLNAFDFDDGTPFSTSSPKYDKNNPFNNRDPRCTLTLFDTVAIQQPNNFYYGKLASGKPKGKLILRKFAIDEGLPASWDKIRPDQDAVLLRFGDVALMYAEAENELNGPGAKVIEAVQKVRGRLSVNLPRLSNGLSKDEMRLKIRNERRVELAFEGGYRYFDMLRWKTLGSVIPTIVDPNGKRRVWSDYNYLWPLPTTALNRNPKLEQNPGYPRL